MKTGIQHKLIMNIKSILKYLLATVCGVALAVLLVIGLVQTAVLHTITSAENASPVPVAIVLGASVKTDGTASDALFDRVATGAKLFHDKKADKLLMTGDDGAFHVNEVETMKRLAMAQGVPEENILVDGHGYRTYESCKRAAEVLHIKQAIVVTQRFHLGRALYLCDSFGIEVQGVAADRQHYVRIIHFWLRDLLASVKAWWDVNVAAPEPPVSY